MSKPHTQTRTTQLSPDTRVSGMEQGQKLKTKSLNPRRQLAQSLGSGSLWEDLNPRRRLTLPGARKSELRSWPRSPHSTFQGYRRTAWSAKSESQDSHRPDCQSILHCCTSPNPVPGGGMGCPL